MLDPAQRRSLMPFLPAGLPDAWLALSANRLLQTVTRGRLAAVVVALVDPLLQFLHSDLLCLDDRKKSVLNMREQEEHSVRTALVGVENLCAADPTQTNSGSLSDY